MKERKSKGGEGGLWQIRVRIKGGGDRDNEIVETKDGKIE